MFDFKEACNKTDLSEEDFMKLKSSFSQINGEEPTNESVFDLVNFAPFLKRGNFRDAQVSKNERGELVWGSGTWRDGVWEFGRWEDGIWLNGIWEGGVWENGTWWDGTWKSGTWKMGEWLNGKWLGGSDIEGKKGEYHEKGDSPDNWKLKLIS